MEKMRNRLGIIWRRLLVLLIGGIIAVPYGAVLVWVFGAIGESADSPGWIFVGVVGAVVFAMLCVPAFLEVIRALERTMAKHLLDLPIPTPPRRAQASDRWRGALFYFGHATSGALLLTLLIFVLPVVISMLVDPGEARVLGSELFGPGFGDSFITPSALILLSILVLLLCLGIVVAGIYFLPHYAQSLLGPSAQDREALAGLAAAEKFRRNALAREVHDSIGHALTVTTMQAAVVSRLVRSDPDSAEAAAAQIAHTGREAVAQLDYVLAMLRSEADGGSGEGAAHPVRNGEPPRRTLDDIERLAADARSLGHPVDVDLTGDASRLDARTTTELYGIAREAMTNSLRHASAPGMTIHIEIGSDRVTLESSNPSRTRSVLEGRGLSGIRDRAEVLGGSVDWNVGGGMWTMTVTIPFVESGTDVKEGTG